MTLQRQAFFASSMRLLFGILALTTFPSVFPRLTSFRTALIGYTALAAVSMVLVKLDIGGRLRAYLLGIIDLSLLSTLLYTVGPASSVMVAAYFLLAILNALVVSPGFGLTLAVGGSLSYGVILIAEVLRVPLLGSTPERWALEAPVSTGHALFAWIFVSFMLGGSTLVVANLVRRLERDEARLQELSQHDPLTGLFNRRHLLDCLGRELARVQRGHPLTVLMLDLDGFKRINDNHGHAIGDQLLEELADALRKTTRATDVPGRWGGDEFVVLLPDTTIDEAQRVAARLTEQIRLVGERFDRQRAVTASVGLADARAGEGAASVLSRADDQAYASKQAGGDRVSMAAPAPRS